MRALQQRPIRRIICSNDMVEDVTERLAFLRHEPKQLPHWASAPFGLGHHIDPDGRIARSGRHSRLFDHFEVDLEQPALRGPYDFIACFGTARHNKRPARARSSTCAEALTPVRAADRPVSSAPDRCSRLRAAMLAGGWRPARGTNAPGGRCPGRAQLLQRCGFADPVADSRHLDVRYSAPLAALVGDLRAQGLTSALASPGPPLTRAMLACGRGVVHGRRGARHRALRDPHPQRGEAQLLTEQLLRQFPERICLRWTSSSHPTGFRRKRCGEVERRVRLDRRRRFLERFAHMHVPLQIAPFDKVTRARFSRRNRNSTQLDDEGNVVAERRFVQQPRSLPWEASIGPVDRPRRSVRPSGPSRAEDRNRTPVLGCQRGGYAGVRRARAAQHEPNNSLAMAANGFFPVSVVRSRASSHTAEHRTAGPRRG